MPRLQLTLMLGTRTVEVLGLIDTGSAINVLPYSVGINLGAVWEQEALLPPLAGNLANAETRSLIVQASHPQLTPDDPIDLIFAWSRLENAPILFGQYNFLAQFRVCFDASEDKFEVYPKH